MLIHNFALLATSILWLQTADLPPLEFGGIALAPVIVAVVELLKRVGLPTQYAPVANAVLSALVYVGITYVNAGTIPAGLVGYVLNTLLYFLSAYGLYSGFKATIKPKH